LKLPKIRLATPEEIVSIEKTSDLTPRSQVWECGGILGVTRLAAEIDPVYYGAATDTRKYFFIWGLENILRGNGLTEYYFNVPVSDKKYLEIVEHFGAVKTSREPEFRFKKQL